MSIIVPRSSPIAEEEATTGSTILNTVAELRIQTGPLRTNMAAQVAGLPSLTVRPTRGNNNLANRAAVDSRPAQWIAAALVEADNSRVAVSGGEQTGWGIARSRAAVRAGEIPAPSAVLPEVGVQRELAVRAGAPAWAAVVVAGGGGGGRRR